MIPPRPHARGVRTLCLALAGFALATSCSQNEAASKTPKTGELKRREPARVRAVPVEQREMVRTLQTTTVVHSEKEIQLFPRASGVVTEVFVQEGALVEVGDVLATLDDREAKAMLAEAHVAIAEAKDSIERAAVAVREAQARVDQSQLEWEQAVRDYERNEKAALISQQALETLRTTRDSRASDHQSAKLAYDRSVIEGKSAATSLQKAELALARAELEMSYTRIQAPIAGVVAARNVRIGGTVGRGTSVIETAGAAFVLTDPDDLHVEFHRPQRELAWFLGAPIHAAEHGHAAGHGAESDGALPSNGSPTNGDGRPVMEMTATAEALPGLVFRGAIERISPAINPEAGSFAVHAHLEPVDIEHPRDAAATDAQAAAARRGARLLPGMLVRLEIVTDRHPNALVVPKRALRREGEVDLLFVVHEGRARRIEVSEGFSDDQDVEVVPREAGALKPGDLVVVVGNRELEDGGEVQLEAAPAPVTPDAEAEAPAAGTETSDTAKG